MLQLIAPLVGFVLAPALQQERSLDDIRQAFQNEVRTAAQTGRRVSETTAIECLGALLDGVARTDPEPGRAVAALVFSFQVLDNVDTEGTRELWSAAMELLIDEYVNEPDAAVAVYSLSEPREELREERGRFLRRIDEETTSSVVRGTLRFVEARDLAGRDSARLPKEVEEDVVARLLRVQEEFGDVKNVRGGGTLGEAAGNVLFDLQNLRVGCRVPDIEGRDLEGVEFRLSDYAGKVVLLDFWGDW